MTYPDIAPIIVAAVSIAANFVLSYKLRKEQRQRLSDHEAFKIALRQLSADLEETVREKSELQTDYRQALRMVKHVETVRSVSGN